MRFNEIFDGVVLAYDVDIPSKDAKILPGIHPYFGVRLKAKLLLFSPKPNMLIEGKVVKLAQESIHIVVLGFSSAIITDEEIRGEFKYKIKHGEAVFVSRSHKRHVIKVGTMIRFLVKRMYGYISGNKHLMDPTYWRMWAVLLLDEEILHISGSLNPPHTGSILWLDKKLEDASPSSRSTKKRRENGESREMQEHDTVDGGVFSLDNSHHIKKSKKRKISEES
ncbi:hypothetical protein CK203_019823 [Vitis vinifera]|uniref:DNA-directed RNA polymerase subunit n=1 Tax=Vitis vinifera TaxID=29760 RepID=A0A438J365_VITVI|nr:hypothetical protein CK203_019823 [Vitis vinifera]